MDNAIQAHLRAQRKGYIFLIPGHNLSPHNYCVYVLVLIIFQHVNAFPVTEAEQMHESTNCFLLVNGYIFPIRHRNQPLCFITCWTIAISILYSSPAVVNSLKRTSTAQFFKKGEGKCVPNFLPYAAHLLFSTWNGVVPLRDWGSLFADSTLVVRECKVGRRGGRLLLRELEGARGPGRVEPPVTVGC